ncbi:MAG TPA: hypothetical protein VHC18_07690 [Amycolatopsis sp.]|nr:hypothetical protein [Amycolatopsis sp.]
MLARRTALIVAHRLTHAARADRIVVLVRAWVIETGTHAGLVEAGGADARPWSPWAARR